MSQVIESIEREAFKGAAQSIERGFCIIIRDFCASVVPFKTKSVEYAVNTIPWYKIEIPNGEIEEFNEFDLCHSKEELEEQCKIMNEKLKKERKRLGNYGIDLLRKFELQEHRCPCGRLLGKFAGQAEVKCPKCGKVNVIGGADNE